MPKAGKRSKGTAIKAGKRSKGTAIKAGKRSKGTTIKGRKANQKTDCWITGYTSVTAKKNSLHFSK